MSTHKWIDRVCAAAAALSLLLALAFANSEALGVRRASPALGYESRLFDAGRVHTIDIVMDDWEGFLEGCEDEAYRVCSLVIDGEACRNAGIRAKGNTSLTAVSALDSSRYSFKIEFDHYDSAGSYYGLDKLSLNNAIQDATYMKDYLAYRLMGSFGVAAPLCSYAFLTVNGQDWGLYLAVEGVEDAFLQRNYGADHGALYKPDSLSLGGGAGNGRAFDMENVLDFSAGGAGEGGGAEPPALPGGPSQTPDGGGEPPEGFDPPAAGMPDRERPDDAGGGMGSSDVKLQYIDDDPASYPNIFRNAKTEITQADQARLIRSLKALSAGEELEEVLDLEAVLRYFVVHNFVCNGDSYTGSMVHNYYLYEEDGRLSMIPWDYNLAFGTFQPASAAEAVNAPLDTPVSGGGGDRPMVDWIFSDEAYRERYHQLFAAFLEGADFSGLIEETAALIAPYVERDPTRFYSYEAFEAGVAALQTFCRLRSESAAGQLDGSIPATSDGQAADPSALVDASGLNLADMGSMTAGGTPGGSPQAGRAGGLPSFGGGQAPEGAGGRELSGNPEQPEGGGALPLGASLALLLAGLAAAGLFRRRRYCKTG